jgi:CubicO group peptidase (beta-lactamase class C family)
METLSTKLKSKIMKGVYWVVMASFGFVACAQNQGNVLSKYFKEKGKNENINGGFLFAEKDKIVFSQAFGYSNFEEKKQQTINTQFNIASISKIFTSVAVLQLHEKGKLNINDKLVKHFSDLPYSDITIKQALSHTSGLPDLEIFGYLIEKNKDTIVTNACVIPALKVWKQGLYFKPGDDRRYSNIGYNLLALLVEKVSGKSFDQYLAENIFNLADMKNSYLDLKADKNRTANDNVATVNTMLHKYDTVFTDISIDSRFRYPIYNCSGLIGQGNIISTTEDLQKFDQAVFAYKLLKKAILDLALTPIKLNSGKEWWEDHMDTMQGKGRGSYGLGWYIFDQPDYGKSVGHGGYLIGLASFYYHNLTNKQTVIAYQNTWGGKFGNYVTSMMTLMNGKPEFIHPYTIKKSLVDVYGTAMVSKGVAYANKKFEKLKLDTAHYYFMEHELNDLGYEFLWESPNIKNNKVYSVASFRMNTILNPKSANVYDSYAESLWKAGLYNESITNYNKSLRINPANEDGKRNLQLVLMEQNQKPVKPYQIRSRTFSGSETEIRNIHTIEATDDSKNLFRITTENEKVIEFSVNNEKLPSELIEIYTEVIEAIKKNQASFKTERAAEVIYHQSPTEQPKNNPAKNDNPEGLGQIPDPKENQALRAKNRALIADLVKDLVSTNAIGKNENVDGIILTDTELIVNGGAKSVRILGKLKAKYKIKPDFGIYYGNLEIAGSGIFISPSEIN